MPGFCTQIFTFNNSPELHMAEIDNWDGFCCIGKRSNIDDLYKSHTKEPFTHLKNPVIYFLLGKDLVTNNTKIYIGESEEIINRLKQHSKNKKKSWFTDFIIFGTKKGNLNKAHMKFLEADFFNEINNYFSNIILDNACQPKKKSSNKLQYTHEAQALGFKEKIIFIIKLLNIIDFTQKNTLNTQEKNNSNTKISLGNKNETTKDIFYKNLPNQPKNYQAQLIISNNNYILLKNSYIIKNPAKSFKNYYCYKQWLNIIESYSKPDPINKNCHITTEDLIFTSSSTAGSIVNARSTNGRTEWKLKDGTTLHEYETKKS